MSSLKTICHHKYFHKYFLDKIGNITTYLYHNYLNTKRLEDYELYKDNRKEAKVAIQRQKGNHGRKFRHKMKKNCRENKKLFYDKLQQFKQIKEYNMLNIKKLKREI